MLTQIKNKSENSNNKIQSLEVENFTCFSKANLEFSKGINVFIGENGTGKTHLLKLMYVLGENEISDGININEIFGVKKSNFLIRKNGLVSTVLYEDTLAVHALKIEKDSPLTVTSIENEEIYLKSIYLPPQEMLSWHKGFIHLYEKFENDFDRVYRDLAVALNARLLKNSYLEKAEELTTLLEEAIDAKIIKKDDDRFYFQFKNGNEISAASNAQGINKLGQLIYLIQSGGIEPGSIIFWDEPETNLNPKYILVVVKFLKVLANAGCQIFISTHNYLIAYELSQMAEYREVQENVPDIRFFGLYKSENGTEVKAADTMIGLDNEPILNAHSLHQEKEENLASIQLQKDLA